jgi:prophage tail gpP-like protein
MQKITIKINDRILEGFDNISVIRDIENFCANFSFNAFSENKIILPFNPSDEAEIFVGGELFLTGLIDRIYTGYTADSHFYNIAGRDRTSVLVDNSAEGNLSFTTPINLVDIIERLISDLSIDIEVIPPSEPIEDFKKEELSSGEEGENLFNFIERLSRQRGILLRTDELGDIILEKLRGDEYKVKLLNELNNPSNNILKASLNRDYSNRYYRYQAHSQTNMSSKIQSSPNYNITGQYIDNGKYVNRNKYLEVESELSNNGTNNVKRAEWEGKIRAARSEIYSCSVRGFVADETGGFKDFWNSNRLIKTKDDFLNINETLLIKNVNFEYSDVGGCIANLDLVNKDAYIIT